MSVGQKKRKGEEEELTEDSRSKETRKIWQLRTRCNPCLDSAFGEKKLKSCYYDNGVNPDMAYILN